MTTWGILLLATHVTAMVLGGVIWHRLAKPKPLLSSYAVVEFLTKVANGLPVYVERQPGLYCNIIGAGWTVVVVTTPHCWIASAVSDRGYVFVPGDDEASDPLDLMDDDARMRLMSLIQV